MKTVFVVVCMQMDKLVDLLWAYETKEEGLNEVDRLSNDPEWAGNQFFVEEVEVK